MLRCIDCSQQICPKCMVQCPVGNRCPACTKRFTSHVLQIDLWIILRCFIAGVLSGLLFDILQVFLPIGGFYSLPILYLLGYFVGKTAFKFIGHKLGGRVAGVISIGVVASHFCVAMVLGISFISLALGLFLVGIISPFLGWGLPWAGWRR